MLINKLIPSINTVSSSMNQGTRTWYLCHHSIKLPVKTFTHLDDVYDSIKFTNFTEEPPNANSTLIEPLIYSETNPYIRQTPLLNNSIERQRSASRSSSQQAISPSDSPITANTSHDVGHMSHIPRIPPNQATFTLPTVMEKSVLTMYDKEEDIFGMIKLRDNDVCYTSGTIEWVGRKRSYPINSGFKLMKDKSNFNESHLNKLRKFNKTFTSESQNFTDCNCANVLPTVNAIVDHLNALHEAVDLVDLRLNTLEDIMSKNDK